MCRGAGWPCPSAPAHKVSRADAVRDRSGRSPPPCVATRPGRRCGAQSGLEDRQRGRRRRVVAPKGAITSRQDCDAAPCGTPPPPGPLPNGCPSLPHNIYRNLLCSTGVKNRGWPPKRDRGGGREAGVARKTRHFCNPSRAPHRPLPWISGPQESTPRYAMLIAPISRLTPCRNWPHRRETQKVPRSCSPHARENHTWRTCELHCCPKAVQRWLNKCSGNRASAQHRPNLGGCGPLGFKLNGKHRPNFADVSKLVKVGLKFGQIRQGRPTRHNLSRARLPEELVSNLRTICGQLRSLPGSPGNCSGRAASNCSAPVRSLPPSPQASQAHKRVL